MSLIEEAAKRLEQLRRAGVTTPADRPQPRTSARAELRPAEAAPISAHAQPPKATAPSRMVTVDAKRLAEQGFVIAGAPRSATADEFRIIKRPLLANASGRGAAPVENGNLIMVTSAVPHDGKTFTAVNLALSIADELDRTVLLVDADVARPAVPALFGLPYTRGLLDALQDPSLDVGQYMLRTNIPNLVILPSGTQTPRATELLASEGMARMLDEIGKRYADRVIIFDTPPLLATTEARVLATHMGQIVFVVRAERTAETQVVQGLAAIESCPVKLLVLNMVESRAQGAHGYGYGYGYRA
jgi:exopolysaccharide/PEP-CTERM locus tyrosine autokinase